MSIFIWDVRGGIQRGIEREAKKEEKEKEDNNDDKDNEYFVMCYKIVEEIMNECSDVILRYFIRIMFLFRKISILEIFLKLCKETTRQKVK